MRRMLARWMRAQMEMNAFETKADVSTFVLQTVIAATVMATVAYLTVAAVLDHFGLLPYPFESALSFGGTTTIFIASSVTALLAWLVGSTIRELSISRAQFARLSRTDALSGLLNRGAIVNAMAETDATGFFVLFDVDRFKAVNDRHGHAVGDRVIVAVAEELQRVFPPPNVVSRFGGEEFAVFMPEDDADDCRMLVEEARRSISVHRVISGDDEEVTVTVSAGIAARTAGRSFDAVFDVADRALYLAKSLGRDRVVRESEMEALSIPPRHRAAGGRRG